MRFLMLKYIYVLQHGQQKFTICMTPTLLVNMQHYNHFPFKLQLLHVVRYTYPSWRMAHVNRLTSKANEGNKPNKGAKIYKEGKGGREGINVDSIKPSFCLYLLSSLDQRPKTLKQPLPFCMKDIFHVVTATFSHQQALSFRTAIDFPDQALGRKLAFSLFLATSSSNATVNSDRRSAHANVVYRSHYYELRTGTFVFKFRRS